MKISTYIILTICIVAVYYLGYKHGHTDGFIQGIETGVDIKLKQSQTLNNNSESLWNLKLLREQPKPTPNYDN